MTWYSCAVLNLFKMRNITPIAYNCYSGQVTLTIKVGAPSVDLVALVLLMVQAK